MSTSISAITTFPELTFTGNNLADVIRFIREGNVVALYTEGACRVFHAISAVSSDEPASLEKVRVIYLDCNSHPGLLAKGEWEYFIKEKIKDVNEVAVSALRNAIIDQRKVPNKCYISLG